jgi:hypothetical protein
MGESVSRWKRWESSQAPSRNHALRYSRTQYPAVAYSLAHPHLTLPVSARLLILTGIIKKVDQHSLANCVGTLTIFRRDSTRNSHHLSTPSPVSADTRMKVNAG